MLPGDILVNETTAQYLLRKLNATTELQRQLTAYEAAVTNLTAQVQGLAAENADLKHPGTYLPSKRETPITDAVLAEIRTQGVDAFAADLGKAYQQLRAGSPQAKALKAVVFRAASFSEQLRKEQDK